MEGDGARSRWIEGERGNDRTYVCVRARAHDGVVRGVGGDWPTKPYGQNYHTHTPAPAPI